jgi:diadenylate cyclase
LLELFKIGFLSITIVDLVDITFVTILFYWLYRSLRNTITVQILFGLIVLIGLKFFTETINLKAVNWILNTIVNIWLLAYIILFQPELRKLLLKISRSPIFKLFAKTKFNTTLSEIIDAAEILSKKHIGALIVLPRSQNVQMTIDTGVTLQASVTTELIESIFSIKSPLHDGAIVIENNTIIAARCVLPLAGEIDIKGRKIGTRHRAGIGLTEQLDSLVIIVSEETGWISLADEGRLITFKKDDFQDFKVELSKRTSEINA